MPHNDDPFGRRRARPEMGMANYPGRTDFLGGRTTGPGAPAEPIRPIIGRPDREPGYVPNPPPSRVRPGGGLGGGGLTPPQRPGGLGALHITDPRGERGEGRYAGTMFSHPAEAISSEAAARRLRDREIERERRERGGLASGLPGYRGRF